jgi:hypothetical protein
MEINGSETGHFFLPGGIDVWRTEEASKQNKINFEENKTGMEFSKLVTKFLRFFLTGNTN